MKSYFMKQMTIKLGFTRYSDKALERKTRRILTRMTGNLHFPDPVPSLKDVQQQLAEFHAAVQALDGRPINYMLKKRARKTLEHSMKLLGQYVLRQSNHQEDILESSGYDMIQQVQLFELLDQPGGFRVKAGAGSALVSSDRVKGARNYVFEYTEAPLTGDSIWTTETDIRPMHAFTELLPGKAYCFRMGATDTVTPPVYTPVVSRLVS